MSFYSSRIARFGVKIDLGAARVTSPPDFFMSIAQRKTMISRFGDGKGTTFPPERLASPVRDASERDPVWVASEAATGVQREFFSFFFPPPSKGKRKPRGKKVIFFCRLQRHLAAAAISRLKKCGVMDFFLCSSIFPPSLMLVDRALLLFPKQEN